VAGTGLVVDDSGFEVLAAGERVGPRRLVGATDEEFLGGLAARYARAVRAHAGEAVFAGLGRELFGWLDGDEGQLTQLLGRAVAPLVFEVAGPWRPSARAWAVLRAPFELLAPSGEGFLAGTGFRGSAWCGGWARPEGRLNRTGSGWGWRSWRRRRGVSTSWTSRRRRPRSCARPAAGWTWWWRTAATRCSWGGGWGSWAGCRWCTCRATGPAAGGKARGRRGSRC
jgi:hypothetical protein